MEHLQIDRDIGVARTYLNNKLKSLQADHAALVNSYNSSLQSTYPGFQKRQEIFRDKLISVGQSITDLMYRLLYFNIAVQEYEIHHDENRRNEIAGESMRDYVDEILSEMGPETKKRRE